MTTVQLVSLRQDSPATCPAAPWTRGSNDEAPRQQARGALTTDLGGWIAASQQNGRSAAKLARKYRQPADCVQSVVDTPPAVAEERNPLRRCGQPAATSSPGSAAPAGAAVHAIIRPLAVCVTAINSAGESSATSGTVSREGFRLAAVDEIGRSRSPLQRP